MGGTRRTSTPPRRSSCSSTPVSAPTTCSSAKTRTTRSGSAGAATSSPGSTRGSTTRPVTNGRRRPGAPRCSTPTPTARSRGPGTSRATRSTPTRDTRVGGGFYGVIANPIDHTVWGAETGPFPGRLVRLDRGDNPPETCVAEVYEPPSIQNPDIDPAKTGHAPRGIDVDRNGVIWTALSGSGHLASFDRSKCRVLNGPDATGQHCPEGWTLYPTPGPQMKGVTDPGSGDFHYYNWVDQFNTLGLGANTPIANGSGSDSLLALRPDTGRVGGAAYPPTRWGSSHAAWMAASTTRTRAGRDAGSGPTTAATSTGISRAARGPRARWSISSCVQTRWRNKRRWGVARDATPRHPTATRPPRTPRGSEYRHSRRPGRWLGRDRTARSPTPVPSGRDPMRNLRSRSRRAMTILGDRPQKRRTVSAS